MAKSCHFQAFLRTERTKRSVLTGVCARIETAAVKNKVAQQSEDALLLLRILGKETDGWLEAEELLVRHDWLGSSTRLRSKSFFYVVVDDF